jgi:signal transduction histidine kinase
MTEEQFTPQADLLSDVWRLSRTSWLAALICLPVLVLFALGIPFSELAPVGQICLFIVAVVMVPSLGIEFIYRRWGANPPTGIVGLVMLVLAPLNAFVAVLLGPHVPPLRGMLNWAGIWGHLAVGGGFALLMWLVLVARSHILGQLRAQVEHERTRADDATRERQLVEAKLQNLQAQIEPHFLYNTLANVQHLIAHRPADAEAMLTGLIRYLRESLPKMRSTCSSLEQEFALAAAYLDIARIRLGGRLTVDVDLPGDLKTCPFPPLIIQTLVENALKHGVEPKVGPATIRIGASAREDEVCVWVADDGVGLGVVQGTGVGLRNTRERLAAIYGPEAALTLAPNTPNGVVATVCIPRESA